jgi:hypothetical protein
MLTDKSQEIFDQFNKNVANLIPVQLYEEDGDLYAKGVLEFSAPLRIGTTDILEIRDVGELELLTAHFIRAFANFSQQAAASLEQAFIKRLSAAVQVARGPAILTPNHDVIEAKNIKFPGGANG